MSEVIENKPRKLSPLGCGCASITLLLATGAILVTSYVDDTLYRTIWGPCGLLNGKCTNVPAVFTHEKLTCVNEPPECLTLMYAITSMEPSPLVSTADHNLYIDCEVLGLRQLEEYLVYPPPIALTPLETEALTSTVAGTASEDANTYDEELAYPYGFNDTDGVTTFNVATAATTSAHVCEIFELSEESAAETKAKLLRYWLEDRKRDVRTFFENVNKSLSPSPALP